MPVRKPNVVLSIADGIATIDVSCKKFPDTVTLVDEADLHILVDSPRRWYAARTCGGSPYAVRNMGAGKTQRTELLHRVILGLTERDVFADHRKHNTLDNRRSQLRHATPGQNTRNQRPHIGSSSRYLGVSWCQRDRVWRAYRSENNKARALGSFHDEEAAAHAYDDAVRHDPFANLNFPERIAA